MYANDGQIGVAPGNDNPFGDWYCGDSRVQLNGTAEAFPSDALVFFEPRSRARTVSRLNMFLRTRMAMLSATEPKEKRLDAEYAAPCRTPSRGQVLRHAIHAPDNNVDPGHQR